MKKKTIILSVLAWLTLGLIALAGVLTITNIKFKFQEEKKYETPKFEVTPVIEEPEEPEELEFQTLDTCLSSEEVYAAYVVDIQRDVYCGKKYYAVTTQNGMLYYSKSKPNIGDTVMWVDDNHNIINCDKLKK